MREHVFTELPGKCTDLVHIRLHNCFYTPSSAYGHVAVLQGGSNMTGTNCDLFTYNQSRSYLNHLVYVFRVRNPVSMHNIVLVCAEVQFTSERITSCRCIHVWSLSSIHTFSDSRGGQCFDRQNVVWDRLVL
jgi:hypothetical protein